jgi:hypothetical protein
MIDVSFVDNLDNIQNYRLADSYDQYLIKVATGEFDYDPDWYKKITKKTNTEPKNEIDPKFAKRIVNFVNSRAIGGISENDYLRLCREFGLTYELTSNSHYKIMHPKLNKQNFPPKGCIIANPHGVNVAGKMAFGAVVDLQKALRIIYSELF